MTPSNTSDQEKIRQLEQQVERLQLVLWGAGLGSWDWNVKTNAVSFDRGWCIMLGLDPASTPQVLDTWDSRVHPEDKAKAYADIQDHILGKTQFYENVHRMRHADGHWVWILDKGRVTERDTTGSAVRFSGTHLDVTQQVEAQKELENQRVVNVHASRMALLGEMAGGIAHEINSPLAIITTLAAQLSEYVQSPQMLPARVISTAKTLESTGFRIARIVTSMKNLSRDSSSEPMIRTNLKAIVEDAALLVQERFRLQGIQLDTSKIPPDCTVRCQPNELSQVLLNLIQNARDAVETTAEKWIRIEARTKDGAIEISVIDSGAGIPDNIHQRLFQPFFTTKSLGQGTGLGLPICQRIVRRHGGTIWHIAGSHPTRFVVTLPLGVDSTNP